MAELDLPEENDKAGILGQPVQIEANAVGLHANAQNSGTRRNPLPDVLLSQPTASDAGLEPFDITEAQEFMRERHRYVAAYPFYPM